MASTSCRAPGPRRASPAQKVHGSNPPGRSFDRPARGVDIEHPDWRRSLVPEGVLRALRDQDERAERRRHILAFDREDHLALEDVEGVVLLLVNVCLELAAGGDLDDGEVEPRRVDGPCEE